MLSTPYLHTGWAFEVCALGCSLGLIFLGMCRWQPRPQGSTLGTSLVPLASQTPTTSYATSTFPIMHPPKFRITFVFHFSWVSGFYSRPKSSLRSKRFQSSYCAKATQAIPREIENNAHAKFGEGGGGEKGQTRCIMGNM